MKIGDEVKEFMLRFECIPKFERNFDRAPLKVPFTYSVSGFNFAIKELAKYPEDEFIKLFWWCWIDQVIHTVLNRHSGFDERYKKFWSRFRFPRVYANDSTNMIRPGEILRWMDIDTTNTRIQCLILTGKKRYWEDAVKEYAESEGILKEVIKEFRNDVTGESARVPAELAFLFPDEM